MYNAGLCCRGKPPSIFAPPLRCWLLRWARRATTPALPRIIKRSPPPPEFNLGARVFDGAVADLAARGANGDLDFQQWLAVRRLQIVKNAEHAFAGALSESALQLPFVKRARVDLQTSLGGRKGAGGVDVAGALRETDDDIVGWQLRGYAAEHGAKGLNTGLFYRRVVGGALAGVNVFADYEDGDDGDFWRWSVGGDVKNRFGEISANHYFAITDAQMVGDKTAYTREGYDVDLAVRIPRLEWAKARVGYYEFKGEFGDEDENGFRAGLDLSPGDGLVVGVEYDDDDGKFGGNISYTHHFGEAGQSAQRAGDFNPRAHFYDSVRREYSQRISRTSGGGGDGFVIVETGVNVDVKNIAAVTTTANLTAASVTNAFFPFASIVIVSVSTGNGGVTMRHQGERWSLNLSANASIEFYGGTVMNVASGMGEFIRSGGNLTMIRMGGVTITLLGTHFDFNVISNTSVSIDLFEGALGIPATNVAVQFADTATVRIGGDTVGCGGDAMTLDVTAKCEIKDAVTVADMTLVTENTSQSVLAGSISLAGSNTGISAFVDNAAFTVTDNGSTGFNVHLIAASVVADRNVKVARVTVRGSSLQTAKEFVFSVRVNPQPINLMFVADINSAPLTMAGDIIIGTLEVTNGFGATNINFAAGSGAGFRLDNIADAPNRRALVLSGDNTSPRTVSVTLTGDDDNASQTDAAMVSVTVMVADALRVDGGMFTILADTSSLPLITISAIGGEGPHSYSATETPSGTHPAVAAAGSGPYTISKTGMQQTAGADLRWIYQVTDSRNSVKAATVDVSVVTTISLSASNLIAEAQRGAITTNILQTLGTLGAVGGLGNYVFTSSDSRASLVDMSVMVLNFTAAAETTVHYTIDDRNADNTAAPLTPPVTFFVTVNAIAPLALEPIVLTLTAGDTVPAQGTDSGYRIRASGGTPPYTYGYERGFRNHPFELAGNGSSSGRLNWSGQVLQSNLGIYNADSMQVRDSSTPPRGVTLRITVHIVSPPSGG